LSKNNPLFCRLFLGKYKLIKQYLLTKLKINLTFMNITFENKAMVKKRTELSSEFVQKTNKK
jgi:hypothetical protein